jgi:hypothetical protein
MGQFAMNLSITRSIGLPAARWYPSIFRVSNQH